jgi:3-oxoacyl-[acyl-carrier-protein] synthase II
MTRNLRVFVSGLGAVAPNGVGVASFWKNTRTGVSGVKKIDFFDNEFHRVKIAGFIRDGDDLPWQHKIAGELYDRISILSKVAADEALRHSGLEPEDLSNVRTGIIMGVALSGMHSLDTCYEDFILRKRGMILDSFIASMPNIPAALLAMEYNIIGPNYTVNTACSSSLAAIGLAYQLIKNDVIEMCLAGGADAPITSPTLRNFEMLKILNSGSNDVPHEASQPFHRDRQGFVLSEGAGFVTLESEKHLRRRGGMAIAEIIGYGSTNNASHILTPNAIGQMEAVRLALADAEISPRNVGYIHAHGTGTRQNDLIETEVIKRIYGRRAYDVPISSVKSMIGHTLGASGVLSLICTIMAIREHFLPPTINLTVADPQCDLDYIPNMGRTISIETAVVHGFGFGGNNNILVIRSAE